MNINGPTRASIETGMINSMSRESLMSIAPAVSQLAQMDLLSLPARNAGGPATEADRLLEQIRRVLSGYAPQGSPHNSRGVVGQWPQEIRDAMRESFLATDRSNVAPGQSVGFGGMFNPATGEHIRFNSQEERDAHINQSMRSSDRRMVNQLMDRINSLGGSGGMSVSGGSVDESV